MILLISVWYLWHYLNIEDQKTKICKFQYTTSLKGHQYTYLKSKNSFYIKVGVTSMFVSNLPPEVKKETLKNVFSKHGEVVDVYIALKKDVNRKTFAFVRFKRVDDEIELERALQGIKIGTRMLGVNIARFERKLDNGGFSGIRSNSSRNHNQFPKVKTFMNRDC